MDVEKRKYKCEGCGVDRPCCVETNQNPRSVGMDVDDLKCILDDTNQTGYSWMEVQGR